MIHLCTCFSPDADPKYRFIAPSIVAGGYQATFASFAPLVAWGCKRFLMHNPGGLTLNYSGEGTHAPTMDFSQFAQCAASPNPRLRAIAAGYWPALHSFVTSNPSVEVITYVGSGFGGQNASAAALISKCSQYRSSLAIDAAQQLFLSDTIADTLFNAGITLYGEGYPAKINPAWAQFPVLATRDNMAQALDPANDWPVPLADVTGELVEIVNMPSAGKTWNDTDWDVPEYQRVTKAGRTFCGAVTRLMDRGTMAAINAPVAGTD